MSKRRRRAVNKRRLSDPATPPSNAPETVAALVLVDVGDITVNNITVVDTGEVATLVVSERGEVALVAGESVSGIAENI